MIINVSFVNVKNKKEAHMKLIPEKRFRTETLGMSPTGFWRLKKAGELPAPITIGRRNFYTHDSILEWLETKKKSSVQTIE